MSERPTNAHTTRKTPLTRERVVAAALRIVDRDGLDKLTMRALGTELGVDPMAVYHHLPNKAAVLDGVAEAVMCEVPLDIATEGPWQEQLAEFARGYRATLRAHPNALPVLATRPDTSRAALRVIDTAIGILLGAGLGPSDAVKAMHTASCLIMGHALDEFGFPLLVAEDLSVTPTGTDHSDESEDADYPHLMAVVSVSTEIGVDDTFEMGLTSMIAGFAARVSPTAGRR